MQKEKKTSKKNMLLVFWNLKIAWGKKSKQNQAFFSSLLAFFWMMCEWKREIHMFFEAKKRKRDDRLNIFFHVL